jgi:hypothetical protein
LKRGDSFTEDKNPKFSVCRAVSEGKSWVVKSKENTNYLLRYIYLEKGVTKMWCITQDYKGEKMKIEHGVGHERIAYSKGKHRKNDKGK